MGLGRAHDRVLPGRGSGDQARARDGRAARPPQGRAAGGRRGRRDARARGDLPRVHRGHRCRPRLRHRDADRHRLRPGRAHPRPERARRAEGVPAHARDRGRPGEHRDRRVRLRERRRPGAAGGGVRALRRVRVAVADRGPCPARVRRPRGRVVGGARPRRDRADARGRGARVPHPRGGVPASATRAATRRAGSPTSPWTNPSRPTPTRRSGWIWPASRGRPSRPWPGPRRCCCPGRAS